MQRTNISSGTSYRSSAVEVLSGSSGYNLPTRHQQRITRAFAFPGVFSQMNRERHRVFRSLSGGVQWGVDI